MSNPQENNDSEQSSPYVPPVPPVSTNGYGQQQPGQQGYGYPHTGNQANGYSPNGYPQPGSAYSQQGSRPYSTQAGQQGMYSQPGYQQQYPQPGYPQYGAPRPQGTPKNDTAKRPLVAFVLVMIAFVASSAGSAFFGKFIGEGWQLSGVPASEIFTADSYGGTLIILQVVCTILGLTGLILSILAIVGNERRSLSIFTLVLSILAPVISYVIFMATLFSYS